MKFSAKLACAMIGACSLMLAGVAAQAATITGLYNTGDGVALGTNGTELHWTLTGGTAYVGGTNGVFPLNGPWLTEDITSRWIGPTVTAGESTDPRDAGFYEYNLSFNLTAIEAAGASFSGRFAADNTVSWIQLNSTPITSGPAGGFSFWTAFSAATPAFQVGQNDLTVRVINFGQATGNPSGLRVEFLDSAVGVVPEPGTWALMIVGFGGAGVMLRRRRAIAA